MLSVIELTLLMYIYGHRSVFTNIAEMGIRLPAFSKRYFQINWTCITPVVLVFIVIVTWVRFTPCFYDDYVFPGWVQVRV